MYRKSEENGNLETAYLTNAVGLILTVVSLSLFTMQVYNPGFIESHLGVSVVTAGPVVGGFASIVGTILTFVAWKHGGPKRRFRWSLNFGFTGLLFSVGYVAIMVYAITHVHIHA